MGELTGLLTNNTKGYSDRISQGGAMEKSTVFMSSRSQAVRLPKVVALPADVKIVDVIAVGRTRIISPAGESWDSWFSGLGVTNDFMSVREQPEPQERGSF